MAMLNNQRVTAEERGFTMIYLTGNLGFIIKKYG
jgi:hypothetical protein